MPERPGVALYRRFLHTGCNSSADLHCKISSTVGPGG